MTGQKELEFLNDDTLAGFRLKKIELYNWGTFHGRVWTLLADGRNILVTGDIGSGKSTVVDAITTLLVPANRIHYNKAAGAEVKERTLKSYVLGHYKAERSDEGYSVRPVSLRGRNNYSVVLGVFSNFGYGQTVTLAQVFWQKEEGQPERFYIVADAELSITGHFADFGNDIKELKKRLKNQRVIDNVFESFPPYGASFRRRFGIENDQALELFLQTVSMKTVGNLTEFVRTHMLESFDTDPRIAALIAHFDDLNRAHNAVLKAKEQIARLSPLVEDLDRHKDISDIRGELRNCRDGLRVYFAHLKAELLEKRIGILDEERRRTEAKLRQLEEKLSRQQSERDNVRQSIAENGGDRIERLKNDISVLLEKKQLRLRKSEEYGVLVKQLSMSFDGGMESFFTNRKIIPAELEIINSKETDLQNSRVDAEVMLKKVRDSHSALCDELESLKKRRSNIDSLQIRIRAGLCSSLGIDEEDLPFAGELMQVNPADAVWEGAAERLLRNFGLSLLVSERFYAPVSQWVDITDTRGRIVYYKVPAKQENKNFDLHPYSLVHKLNVKPGSEFSSWLRSELARRFDYACCGGIEQFRREKQAVTAAGQLKAGGKHEKDDRHDIKDRSRYILGWSNEAKIFSLEQKRKELERDISAAAETIAGLQTGIKIAGERKVLLLRLDGFSGWDEIDWKPAAVQADDLEREKKELESSSNILASLSSQLNNLETLIKEMLAVLDREKDQRSKNEEKRTQAEQSFAECNAFIAGSDKTTYKDTASKLDEYRKEAIGDHHLTVESSDNRQTEMREWLQAKIDSEEKRLKMLEERIIRNMQDYRREYPSETIETDARLESGAEFRSMLSRLEGDDLPKYEARFKALLNENTIREIANFQSQLSRERQIIRERINRINQSLAEIEYNKGRYIRLEAEESPDVDIRDFRQSLRACTEGSLTGSSDEKYAEGKFIEVRAIIDRFRGRDGYSDTDRKWTQKVTDVRYWFVFAASERYKEDDKEYEHYTDSGGKSGGQKEKLAYTVLAASLAYQFGLEWGEVKSRSFRFVVIDEAFGRGSEESTRFGLELFKKLNMQLLIVTPLQKIHIIEPYVANVGFVDCPEGNESRIRNLTIEEYRAGREARAS